jgi:hypothetical protein
MISLENDYLEALSFDCLPLGAGEGVAGADIGAGSCWFGSWGLAVGR